MGAREYEAIKGPRENSVAIWRSDRARANAAKRRDPYLEGGARSPGRDKGSRREYLRKTRKITDYTSTIGQNKSDSEYYWRNLLFIFIENIGRVTNRNKKYKGHRRCGGGYRQDIVRTQISDRNNIEHRERERESMERRPERTQTESRQDPDVAEIGQWQNSNRTQIGLQKGHRQNPNRAQTGHKQVTDSCLERTQREYR